MSFTHPMLIVNFNKNVGSVFFKWTRRVIIERILIFLNYKMKSLIIFKVEIFYFS